MNRTILLIITTLGILTCFNAFAESNRIDYDLDDDGLIEINDLRDFDEIRNNLDGSSLYGESLGCPGAGCIGFELTQNIDFDTNQNGQIDEGDLFWNDGEGWFPIAPVNADYAPFSAIFNGNGHSIQNLFIHRPTQGSMGLFGFAIDAEFSDFSLSTAEQGLVGGLALAPLVSYVEDVKVARVHVKAKVQSETSTSGLIAIGSRAKIIATVVNADIINRNASAGGLLAHVSNAEIIGSESHGSITTDLDYVGGLLGASNHSTPSTILASYSTMDIKLKGSGYIGGLVGSSANIQYSYASGKLEYTEDANVGALSAGRYDTVEHSFHVVDDNSDLLQQEFFVGLASIHCSEEMPPCMKAELFDGWQNLLNDQGAAYWDFSTASVLPILTNAKENNNAPRMEVKSGGTLNMFFVLMCILFGLLNIKRARFSQNRLKS